MTDPRNPSGLLSAPGDFTTVDQSGSVQPLKTYGILRIKVQDQDNNQLDLAGNLKIYVDANKVITTCELLVYVIRKTYKIKELATFLSLLKDTFQQVDSFMVAIFSFLTR